MPELAHASDIVKLLHYADAQKLAAGEGEVVNPYDLSFTWKVKSAETAFQFSVYEMVIQPGKSIPLHIHPYAEFFYCLEGQVDVMQVDESGGLQYVSLAPGECANAPTNNPHGMKNRSSSPAKFLSVSTFEHEKSFDEYQALLSTPAGAALNEEQKSQALNQFFTKYNVTFLDAHEAGVASR